jgi:hypothetical protein
MVRCSGPADGIVEVDGVGAKVREPRLPELKPLPMRASAPEPRNASVARTIIAAVTARKTVRNIKVLPIAAMLPLERMSGRAKHRTYWYVEGAWEGVAHDVAGRVVPRGFGSNILAAMLRGTAERVKMLTDFPRGTEPSDVERPQDFQLRAWCL